MKIAAQVALVEMLDVICNYLYYMVLRGDFFLSILFQVQLYLCTLAPSGLNHDFSFT